MYFTRIQYRTIENTFFFALHAQKHVEHHQSSAISQHISREDMQGCWYRYENCVGGGSQTEHPEEEMLCVDCVYSRDPGQTL